MRSVTRHDCVRGCEVTLFLNEHDDVIGVQLFFEEPVNLYNFKLDNILAPKSMLSPTRVSRVTTPPSTPPTAHQMRQPVTTPRPRPTPTRVGGCGGGK